MMRSFEGWLTDVMRALGFLSRVPVDARWFEEFDGRYDRAARMFPLAGALVALPGAILLVLLVTVGLSPLASALIVVALSIVLTGALHEDGLADFADGLAGRTPECRIAIMRDSAVGAYGVLALILVIGLRVALVAELASGNASLAAVGFFASAAASRAAMVVLWRWTRPASASGAAASVGPPGPHAATFASMLALVLAAPLFVLVPLSFLIALTLAAATTLVLKRDVDKRLGGHTGDVLGAAAVLSEVAFLLGLAVG